MTAPDSVTSVTEESSESPPEELAPRSGRWISANISGRLSRFAVSLFSPLIFFLVAICLRLHWSHSGLYPIAGDEPGYLVASRSLWVHHSVEMTAAYHDAVRRHTLFIGAAKLARTHHGLYSVHGLGLPFLLGPGVILNGSAGARSVMLLIAVAAPILVYATVRLEGVSAARSGVLALALTLSASLLANSAEIYPDLPAGVIAAGVLVLVLRRARLQRVERPSIRYGALGLIALLPWLHTRFLVPCVILAFATILLRRHPSRRSVAIEAGVVALSFVALSGYNLTYFGRLSGGLSVHNEVASAHNILLVFIGLNVDRFQGLFTAQPILLFAVLGIVILLRRYRDVGLLALTLYLAFLASNALRAEYGGFAIAGRFTMSAAIVLLIPAAVGLVEVARRSATAVLGIAIGVIALDALATLTDLERESRTDERPAKAAALDLSLVVTTTRAFIAGCLRGQLGRDLFAELCLSRSPLDVRGRLRRGGVQASAYGRLSRGPGARRLCHADSLGDPYQESGARHHRGRRLVTHHGPKHQRR